MHMNSLEPNTNNFGGDTLDLYLPGTRNDPMEPAVELHNYLFIKDI